MRFPRGLGLGPAAVALAAAASSLFLFSHAPAVHAECGTASSSPCPTPIAVNAFLSIDPTTGDPNTVINVAGGQFLPNQAVGLYWDPHPVSASATADSNGNFNVRVKPYAGDAPGLHKLCATVQPNPCANFTLQALPATPSPSPTPTESPSPTPTPIAAGTTPLAPPPAATINGFDVITKPPFVFLPIAGLAAIALAFGFWLFSYLRRPRQPAALPTAAVVHRAMRPDYSAGFGTPAAPAPAPPEPSAWDPSAAPPPVPPAPQASPPPAEESQVSNVEWGEPVEWGTGSGDWGFPEPPAEGEDPTEPPQSGH